MASPAASIYVDERLLNEKLERELLPSHQGESIFSCMFTVVYTGTFSCMFSTVQPRIVGLFRVGIVCVDSLV